jgi:SAM-dependent methyltransferase
METTSDTPWSSQAATLHNRWSRHIDADYRQTMLRLVCNELRLHPEWTVLDAGCGPGIFYELLPREFEFNYIGIDWEKDMIKYCMFNYPHGVFCRANILELMPSADLVITMNVIQHIGNFEKAIQNLIASARHKVIFCERTHDGITSNIPDPKIMRWRFNPDDFLRLMKTDGWFEPLIVKEEVRDMKGEPTLAIYSMERQS